MKPNPDHLRLPRSPHWPALEKKHLQDHPTCAACGSNKKVQVHHIVPVHVSRSLELEPKNLLTLCQDDKNPTHQCHFKLGHLSNWFNYNRNILDDAQKALLKTYPTQQELMNQPPVPPAPPAAVPEPPNPNPAAASPLDTVKEPIAQPQCPQRKRG